MPTDTTSMNARYRSERRCKCGQPVGSSLTRCNQCMANYMHVKRAKGKPRQFIYTPRIPVAK